MRNGRRSLLACFSTLVLSVCAVSCGDGEAIIDDSLAVTDPRADNDDKETHGPENASCTENNGNDGCADQNSSGDNNSEDIDDCSANPCLNGGSCINEIASYTCECPPGYSGTHCEISTGSVCPPPGTGTGGQPEPGVLLVDVCDPFGPATFRGSGFLHGFSGAVIPDKDLVPLKPRFLRTAAHQIIETYERARALGVTLEVVMSGTWRGGVPGAGGDWSAWDRHVESLLNSFAINNVGDVNYGTWNDPNMNYAWKASDAQFFALYCRTHQLIKNRVADAVMVGPHSSSSEETEDRAYLRAFIDYTIANDCIPDIIAFHDYSANGFRIIRDAQLVRSYFESRGLVPPKIEESDIGVNGPRQFSPGVYVSYFANLERANIYVTAKACWDNDCFTNTLEGLLTKQTRRRRSLWWAYKAYADVTGSLLKTESTQSVDVLAGHEGGTVRALVGRFGSGGEVTRLRFANVGKDGQSLHIKIQHIPHSGANPLDGPILIHDEAITVSGSEVTVALAELELDDAMFIELSGLDP